METELLEQPLGRILDRGPGALTDAELLALLLRTPHSKELPVEKAESLLALFGGISGLGACDPQMAGELVGFEVIDYLLIGGKKWVSLREKRPW